jgi:hypothetical protein
MGSHFHEMLDPSGLSAVEFLGRAEQRFQWFVVIHDVVLATLQIMSPHLGTMYDAQQLPFSGGIVSLRWLESSGFECDGLKSFA